MTSYFQSRIFNFQNDLRSYLDEIELFLLRQSNWHNSYVEKFLEKPFCPKLFSGEAFNQHSETAAGTPGQEVPVADELIDQFQLILNRSYYYRSGLLRFKEL